MTRGSDVIETYHDLVRLDGRRVVATGRYSATFRPIRGAPQRRTPEDRAMLILSDGTMAYLEPLDTPRSIRPPGEITRFNGKRVRVSGTAHKIMPSVGESLITPCLSDIDEVAEDLGESE